MLEQSDDILCNNMKYYDFYAKKKDDLAFCHVMQNCWRPEEKIVDKETKLWQGKKEKDCSIGYHITRGGNAKCVEKEYSIKAGYDNYTPESLKDYLLIPCKQNTYRNYIACDDAKCCSIRHQMFMNQTKRI